MISKPCYRVGDVVRHYRGSVGKTDDLVVHDVKWVSGVKQWCYRVSPSHDKNNEIAWDFLEQGLLPAGFFEEPVPR